MRVGLIIAALLACHCGIVRADVKTFHGQSVTGAPEGDFTDAHLAGADFSQANLFSCQFIGADLHGANFQKSTVIGGSFAFADLTGADFSDADLHNTSLADALNLSKANFHNAKLYDLSDADFSNADLHGQDLTQAKLINTDLRGANLSHCNLSQADLTNANLRNANLTGANLTQATLWNADLYGADLTGATVTLMDVRGADLSTAKGLTPDMSGLLMAPDDPAKLPAGFPPAQSLPPENKTLAELMNQPDMFNSDLRQMNLQGANLQGAGMQGSHVPASVANANFKDANATMLDAPGTDFTGAELEHAKFGSSWMPDANFSAAKNLGDADLSNCRLDRANFSNASASGLKLGDASLRWANLSHANLANADLHDASFIHANLAGADLSGANCAEANFAEADLTGANLSGADASEAWGLSAAQLKSLAHPPARLPERLDPNRQSELAQQSTTPAIGPADDDSDNGNVFVSNWMHNPALVRKCETRLAIGLAVTAVLALLPLRGLAAKMSAPTSNDPDAPFQAAFQSHIKITPRPRNAPEPQRVALYSIWPALDDPTLESHLPIRLRKPPTVGPKGALWFVLINGAIFSLIAAMTAIAGSFGLPVTLLGIAVMAAFVWFNILLAARGRMIAIDRSQVVTAVMRLSDPSRCASVRDRPTSSFKAITWYYKNSGSNTFRSLELNGPGSGRIPLGNYPTEQAFLLRSHLAKLLRIPDEDQSRTDSSD